MNQKEKTIKTRQDSDISIIRYCIFFVMKVTIIGVIELLSSKILQIEKNPSPTVMLSILIVMLIGSYVIYHKNIEDYFNNYSCIIYGIIVSYMYVNGELNIIYNKLSGGITGQNIIQYILEHLNLVYIKKYYCYCLIAAIIIIFALKIISKIERNNIKYIKEYKAKFLNVKNKRNIDEKVLNFNKDDLLVDRYSNYNSLVECVNSEDVYGIAINGRFGSGKSFLVDFFERNNLSKYEFIRIFSLSSNDENVEEYILKQLKK